MQSIEWARQHRVEAAHPIENKRLIQRTSSSGPRIQDAVDLPKMVQVVCRFQADELLDRLPSAYLVDAVALHPPCARYTLQQSQVSLAQRTKDPRRKARLLLRVTQALRPYGLIPPRQGHARIRQHVSQSPPHRQLRVRQVRYDLRD